MLALIAISWVSPNPVSSVSFGASSWTAQFYFHLHSHQLSTEYDVARPIFIFTGAQGSIKLFYKAHQTFDPCVNKAEFKFQVVSGATASS